MFLKTLMMTLKSGLVHQSMIKEEEKDHCLLEKNKKVINSMKDEKGRN